LQAWCALCLEYLILFKPTRIPWTSIRGRTGHHCVFI